MNVSRIVSLHVQSDVSPDAEMISAKKRNRKLKQRSSGLYLVRSGGTYLFQIRLPKRIGGGAGSRPIRISLGALPHQEARELADALAALARMVFKEIEKRMAEDNGADLTSIGSGIAEADMEDDWPYEFVSLILKAGLFDAREPTRSPTPEEAKGLELMRGLVRIGQQVSAKLDGRPYDEMIADNAEMLAASHLAKHDKPAAPGASSHRYYSSTQLSDAPLPQTIAVAPAPNPEPRDRKLITPRISASFVADFMLDRRTVDRRPSNKPLFSDLASNYLAVRTSSKSGKNKDIAIAENRLNLFVELIGDHPVDTYTATDLQAFIELLKHWPSNAKYRPAHLSAREIIASNQPPRFKTLSRKTMEEGYVTAVRAVMNSGQKAHSYNSPSIGANLTYPDSAASSVPTEPLGYEKTKKLLDTGVRTGLLDNAMLPLLAFMTGRRLGLLIHLKGTDFREKYKGVWVAQTSGIVQVDGVWKRIPIKTDASATFFVIHNFLAEIGFVQWAQEQGDEFLFGELMRLADPSKSASSYMSRLLVKAKVKEARGEVFHSLRGGYISETGDQNIEKRDRMLQVGHDVGDDEHDKYGFRTLTEKKARLLANLPLNPEIDLSMYRGLDFDKMAGLKRTRGRIPKAK
ncbi:hypothetical protein [Rhizobium leguminosarum]|uniref:hypothetical protein n=1 Tax=Rhizobium leguminosarum TaxID=384 RepID=UPI0013EE5D32|nr:hypothetical protein [Rhizobium leguminosarum]